MYNLNNFYILFGKFFIEKCNHLMYLTLYWHFSVVGETQKKKIANNIINKF